MINKCRLWRSAPEAEAEAEAEGAEAEAETAVVPTIGCVVFSIIS